MTTEAELPSAEGAEGELKGEGKSETPAAVGAFAAPDPDAPLGEDDALRLLGAGAEAERSEAAQVAAIADLVTSRLRDSASALSIGTVALFQDTVSFGGGLNAGSVDRHRPSGLSSAVIPLEDAEITDAVECFIEPAAYGVAREILQVKGLLVLAGAAGSGRETAAVNLLAEMLALATTDGSGGLHRIVGTSDLAAWEPPLRGAGYLLVAPAEVAGAQGEDVLSRLSARLRSQDSFLVVVTGPVRGPHARGMHGSEHVLPDLGRVDLELLVERRVLGDDPDSVLRAELRSTLESCGALAALREQPVVRTAVVIAAAVTSGRDLRAEVATLRDPSAQVSQWFARQADPAVLSLALATAVLDESSYLTVADAAVSLYGRLASVTGAPADLRLLDQLSDEQAWLALDLKPDAVPTLRFRSPLLAESVLSHAWVRLDGFRVEILGWLRELLGHPDLSVRARAAVAGGLLAWQDPMYAVHGYLRPWAGSQSLGVRQAAATALAVLAESPVPGAGDTVWNLIEMWAVAAVTPTDRRRAKTAVTAAGGQLGRVAPARAMGLLRSALEWHGDWANLSAVAWSVADLFDAGQAGPALDALVEWSRKQDLSEPVTKALSVFLFVARQRDDEGVPTLLALSPTSATAAAAEELWTRALARRPVQTQALEVLREWVEVDSGPGTLAHQRLVRLLQGIAARPGKHRDRLDYYLDVWSRDGGRFGANAIALREAVTRSRGGGISSPDAL